MLLSQTVVPKLDHQHQAQQRKLDKVVTDVEWHTSPAAAPLQKQEIGVGDHKKQQESASGGMIESRQAVRREDLFVDPEGPGSRIDELQERRDEYD